MTRPETDSPAGAPSHPHAVKLMSNPLTVTRAAWIMASTTIAITIISGVLIRFTDKSQFPTIGDGLWWAIQTVTTVGYGDHVPTSTLGRLVAALVMIAGIGFLTIITAAITSTFIDSARRRIAANRSDGMSEKLDQISMRLDRIEAELKQANRHSGETPQ